MSSKIYPFESEFGTIYIEATKQNIDQTPKVDDGTVTVRSPKNIVDKQAKKFEDSLDIVENVSKTLLKKISKVNATEVSLEMGISFNGELGISFLAKSALEANFKINITWKKEKTEDFDIS